MKFLQCEIFTVQKANQVFAIIKTIFCGSPIFQVFHGIHTLLLLHGQNDYCYCKYAKCFAFHCSTTKIRLERRNKRLVSAKMIIQCEYLQYIKITAKDQDVTVEYAAENGTAVATCHFKQIGGFTN